MPHTDYSSVSQLPGTFPVFPLPGTLLFPRGLLPLNIFEPRYLNMLDDVRQGNGLLGMVQSLPTGPKEHPDISNVGCLGRLIKFSETPDGRYLIALEGLARFRVDQEIELRRPYREVMADWTAYPDDFDSPDETRLPANEDIVAALTKYLDRHGMRANWDAASEASREAFINALCASCPFSVIEKQALLEARDLRTRCQMLLALFEIDSNDLGNPDIRQ